MSDHDPFRVDRTAFSVGRLHEPSDEKSDWLARSARERLDAIEGLRQIFYGYDPLSARLQRVLTVAHLDKGGSETRSDRNAR